MKRANLTELLPKVKRCISRILQHLYKLKWIPGIIQKATGSLSYIIDLLNGTTVKTHVDSIKARHCTNQSRADITPEDDTFQLTCPLTDEQIPIKIEHPATVSSATIVSS